MLSNYLGHSLVAVFLVRVADASFFQDQNSKFPDSTVGRTPALGWNSWNTFKCAGATATNALAVADGFVELGLKDVGYTYVNIDDCWSAKSRTAGQLVPDPDKWPNGIKAVVDKIHEKGLKFGLYGDSGTKTCAGYPGSKGFEFEDAQTLASWGVDYWKYDNCYTPCTSSQASCGGGRPIGNSREWYEPMRNAFLNISRPILFSVCQWGRDNVWTWGANYGNSWRMSSDISPTWDSVAKIARMAGSISQYAGPGGFNDLDMLEIGNGELTVAEQRAHFGIWAIAKSPLILGCDLSKISPKSLAIIKNKGIISINQDPLGKAAGYFIPTGKRPPRSGELYPYWSGLLSDGVVIGLVAANGAETLSVNFTDVPGLGAGAYDWIEYYSGKTGTSTSVSFSLDSHDMAVVKVNTARVITDQTCQHNNDAGRWKSELKPSDRLRELCSSGGGCYRAEKGYMCVTGDLNQCDRAVNSAREWESQHGDWWLWSIVSCGGLRVTITE
ncbi:alpha-galactosidase [Pochonia chlamydosporia 170]|uniref:Alpha-galactosidase n=1 Tax=Pochonia chlamydosporia 170 TaxID=1380566 RepID=A0A179FDX2_METCM|nr:alpha-galactosidase [Pochonia chlamydosporia 170]OAQ63714.1 alpha-galactosidase [Pochonia chlamydosporia 170]